MDEEKFLELKDYFEEILTRIADIDKKVEHLIKRQRRINHDLPDTHLNDFMN